jgi:hypothetical protein
MKVSENLVKAYQEDVEKMCHERMLRFVQLVSENYGISLKLLMRDMPNPMGYCMGVKKGGEPCTRKASHDGFCMSHANNHKLHDPVSFSTQVRHNHPFPPMFKKGCPACEASNSNEFRDLRNIM